MPTIGDRKSIELGKGYLNNPMAKFAGRFRDVSRNILNEQQVNVFTEADKAMLNPVSNDAMMNFFVENSADPGSMSAAEYDDHLEMMREQYLNDREAVMEYAAMSGVNPVIGMTFPIHKNLLMNCIFDKGAIPKTVAKSPKFTETMERRYIVDKNGKKYDLFLEQSRIKEVMDQASPFIDLLITLPEVGATDVMTEAGFGSLDNLSIESYIKTVFVEKEGVTGTAITYTDGARPGVEILDAKTDITWSEDEYDMYENVDMFFKPAYGVHNRTLLESVLDNSGNMIDVVSATMQDNKFMVNSLKGKVKAVIISVRKDASNGLISTPSVSWETFTDVLEIPNATPINVAISPEEVKDINALYNINQLTKVMSIINLVLENYKDDTIKQGLDKSWDRMNEGQKITAKFDFVPRSGYALDPIEWRHKTFFDMFDTVITDLINILNDKNVIVTVFGRPDVIRKITPTEYTYVSPDSVGDVELEFSKTVVTSDKRTYVFMSSQKLNTRIDPVTKERLNNNDLMIILSPRNTDRFIYKIYDYQMYVSNEIRNSQLTTLPAVHAFERFKFAEYQPVQARFEILNPTGYSEDDLNTYKEKLNIGYIQEKLR